MLYMLTLKFFHKFCYYLGLNENVMGLISFTFEAPPPESLPVPRVGLRRGCYVIFKTSYINVEIFKLSELTYGACATDIKPVLTGIDFIDCSYFDLKISCTVNILIFN